ncbi:MAG: IS110 family transposase [Bacteroidetes bacterium]|nr:IS110 family transposase [Bacteroidota bacterium]
MKENIAYLSMDLHVNQITLGRMNFDGKFLGNRSFTTSEVNIIKALEAVKEKRKLLAFEEGTLANWVAQVSRPYVTEVIIADPKENALIYKGKHKNDKIDTRKLCRLLRLGELYHIYHPEDDNRAIFKTSAQQYIDFRNQQVALKLKIKSMYRYWGIIDVRGEAVYTQKHRDKYLKQVKHQIIREQLKRLYTVLDTTEDMQESAKKSMKQLGRQHPEIKEFMKIPGIGEIGAHIYNAFIQTPHRFSNIRKVWRYCRLGVIDKSSDGKPLGYKRLDRSGVSELKALSYRAWMSALKSDNEVKRFYSRSLQKTHSRVHARLNTQRKIISVMYGIWRKGEQYRPELFLDSSKIGDCSNETIPLTV